MSEEPDEKRHTLADHRDGVAADHVHDGNAALDHDHDDMAGDTSPARDHLTLTSVGIDIGSSGTQVIFSRIGLTRRGEGPASRYGVVTRETLFQSPVALTPYRDESRIDEKRLADIIDQAYDEARLHPDGIDAGVVIMTGEALRGPNAQAIADLLAESGGEFVCAAAGHHFEAALAAYGSGAARVSRDEGRRILNVDIGGGTTKLAVVEAGSIAATAAVNVGGRLQVVDERGCIVRLGPAGRWHAAMAGFAWNVGDDAPQADMARVADAMADVLIAAIREPQAALHLYLTDPIADPEPIDGVMFSGGVGEYVYGREARDFGDMGKLLGTALARRLAGGALPWKLLPPGECIRATATGAAVYGVQISGSAFYISSPGDLLPRKNLQVLQPPYAFPEEVDSGELASAIRGRFAAFDLEEGAAEVALALRFSGVPSDARIAAFARGIVEGLPRSIASGKPLYLVLDGDIAQALGTMLKEQHSLASELLVIDGVTLRDLDYVDLGRIRLPSHTVPVTIKSLVFTEDTRHPHDPGIQYRRHHGHGHDHAHGHDHDHGHGHGHGHPRSRR